MAEHDEKLFEHEFEEKLRKFDSSIKIPEIPDAQSIFEKAEEQTKVIPFKKYSRYVAAAAAVVLICVSIPIFSLTRSAEFAPQEPAESNKSIFNLTADSAAEAETPAEAVEEACEEIVLEDSETEEIFDETEIVFEGYRVKNALLDFYYASKDEFKEASSSSSSAEEFYAGNSPLAPETIGTDDLRIIENKINKKRSIEITVETDSVSVRLFDNSAEDEIISAFWVEGIYESSKAEGDFYVINLFKNVSEEELLERTRAVAKVMPEPILTLPSVIVPMRDLSIYRSARSLLWLSN